MRIRATAFLFFLLILSIAIPAAPNQADFETVVAAITAPSADVTLSFVQPGRIAKVNIKEGQSVKIGQLLVQQDDAVQRAKTH